jgi:hypothetical protein
MVLLVLVLEDFFIATDGAAGAGAAGAASAGAGAAGAGGFSIATDGAAGAGAGTGAATGAGGFSIATAAAGNGGTGRGEGYSLHKTLPMASSPSSKLYSLMSHPKRTSGWPLTLFSK